MTATRRGRAYKYGDNHGETDDRQLGPMSAAPIHQTAPQYMAHPCGFCNTNKPAPHTGCPGVVTNGNGIVLHCPCGCRARHCRSCGNDNADDVHPVFWRCLDRIGCDTRTAAKREAYREKLLGPRYRKPETNMTTPNPATQEDPKPARAKTGACQCGCGGATKGGRFLPGHDAKLKSALAITRLQSSDRARQQLAAAEEIARGWLKNRLVDEALEAEARQLIERTGGTDEFIRKATKARNQQNGVVDLDATEDATPA